MKKILICGMLLGLLTAVSWAQHGRSIGRGPIATGGRAASFGAIAPSAEMRPSAAGVSHASVSPSSVTKPNAVKTPSKTPEPVKPNAKTDPRDNSVVGSHTESSAPDHVIMPAAHDGPAANR